MGLLADVSSHAPGGDVDARREASTQRGQLVDAPVLREAHTRASPCGLARGHDATWRSRNLRPRG